MIHVASVIGAASFYALVVLAASGSAIEAKHTRPLKLVVKSVWDFLRIALRAHTTSADLSDAVPLPYLSGSGLIGIALLIGTAMGNCWEWTGASEDCMSTEATWAIVFPLVTALALVTWAGARLYASTSPTFKVENKDIRREKHTHADKFGFGWGLDVWNEGQNDLERCEAQLVAFLPVDRTLETPDIPKRPLYWPAAGKEQRIPGRVFRRVDILRTTRQGTHPRGGHQWDVEVAYAEMTESDRKVIPKLAKLENYLAHIAFTAHNKTPYHVVIRIDQAGVLFGTTMDDGISREAMNLVWASTDEPDLEQWRE